MQSNLIYPHITKFNSEPAHLQRLPRVRVAQIVMDYLAHGWSAEEICRQHPYLMPAEVHAAMTYYFDHQPEIEAEIEQEWQQVKQARSVAPVSPFLARIRNQGLR
jgi:hypothetical protein